MIFIILPAYNEAPNIRSLLQHIASEAPKWEEALSIDGVKPGILPVTAVVVDDGSSDNTAQEAQQFKASISIVLLQHERNQGLAAALKTGIDYVVAHANAYDEVITMDADGTHSPEYITYIINHIRNGADIVVASRYAPGGQELGVSGFRRFLSHGARTCYRIFFPHIPLRDFSCGFRGFRAKILKAVAEQWGEKLFQSFGFACTGELMLKSLAFTTPERIKEIPFELHYERKEGASKMPTFKTILSTLWILLKARKWQKSNESNDA